VQVDLEVLLDLQEKDRAVREAEEQHAALQPKIGALDEKLAEAEGMLRIAQEHTQEAESHRAELEGRIESYRVMQERRRQRLEWVRGAKEASAIMAELDLARGVLAKEEAEWMRSAERVQEAEKVVAEAQELVAATKEVQAPEREELAARAAEIEQQIADAQAIRDAAAQQIDSKTLELYQRILRGRAPQALYPLRGGACGHCFTAVPLHRRQQIENGQSVEACEACGVLVYKDTTE
jgi:predicted  nucleic acid-binding Zn-ribbon protein